jgi:16S rRNA (cytidine1402-2'-O)-methyltransferase
VSISPGVLYVMATPIGHLQDITYRAVEVLGGVDLIAAEDTRHSRALLSHYTVAKPLLSLHEHNEAEQSPRIIARLQAGAAVALICDAGTPLISDPGYRLVSAAHRARIRVSPIPGPSAVIAALSVAGLPTDRFVFEGFLPAREAARARRLEVLAREPRTMVFYEASHRVAGCMRAMRDCFGGERRALIARELTKAFETLHGDSLEGLCEWLQRDTNHRRGEFVVVVCGRPAEDARAGDERTLAVLQVLLAELPLRQAVDLAARITGEARNRVYRLALSMNAS